MEQNLTGGGTSHRDNGIAVQPKVFGLDLPQQAISILKTKQRSISTSPTMLMIQTCNTKEGFPFVQILCQYKSFQVGQASIYWHLVHQMLCRVIVGRYSQLCPCLRKKYFHSLNLLRFYHLCDFQTCNWFMSCFQSSARVYMTVWCW
jgi:hypothetical protein